jgi:hypothetical protein
VQDVGGPTRPEQPARPGDARGNHGGRAVNAGRRVALSPADLTGDLLDRRCARGTVPSVGGPTRPITPPRNRAITGHQMGGRATDDRQARVASLEKLSSDCPDVAIRVAENWCREPRSSAAQDKPPP